MHQASRPRRAVLPLKARRVFVLVVAAVVVSVGLASGGRSPSLAAAPALIVPQAFVPSDGSLLLDLDAKETAVLVKAKNTILDVRGATGLASAAATHVLVEVRLTRPSKAGRVLLAPGVRAKAIAASTVTVPFTATTNRRVTALIPIGVGGTITVATSASAVALQLAVLGWVGPQNRLGTGEEAVRALSCRLLDTSTDLGGAKGLIEPGDRLTFPVSGVAQVPDVGAASVMVAITASDARTTTKVFVSGGGATNFFTLPAKSSRTGLLALAAPAGAEVALTVTGGTANVALDIIGYDTGGDAGVFSGGPCDGPAIDVQTAPEGVAATPPTVIAVPVTVAAAPITTAATTVPPATTTTTTIAPTTTGAVVVVGSQTNAPGSQGAGDTSTTTTSTPSGGQTSSSTTSTTSTSLAPVAGRALQDRPDEIVGQQFHVIYAIPADGVDQELDTSAIKSSIIGMQGWLATQTGGKSLKIDTFQGQPDISFRRMIYDSATLADKGPAQLYWVGVDLTSAGFVDPNKWYLVYYGGASKSGCGQSPRPPTVGGHFAAVFLQGKTATGGACNQFAFPGGNGYFEMAMMHGALHMLGAIPSCSLTQGRGHAAESNDIMFGDRPGWQVGSLQLDLGHNDYFGHGKENCVDVANSTLLQPTAASAVAPPEGPIRPGVAGEDDL